MRWIMSKPSKMTFLLPLLALIVSVHDSAAGTETANTVYHTPNLVLGGAAGMSDHFGKTNEIDAVSGATTLLPDEKKQDVGGVLGGYADAGLLKLGVGNLGISTVFLFSFPNLYFNVAFTPRYRFVFSTRSKSIPRIEPWIGFLATLTFEERISRDAYFMLGGALGCDVALGQSRWLLGLGIYANMVNVVPVEESISVDDASHPVEHRLDAIFIMVNLGRYVL